MFKQKIDVDVFEKSLRAQFLKSHYTSFTHFVCDEVGITAPTYRSIKRTGIVSSKIVFEKLRKYVPFEDLV